MHLAQTAAAEHRSFHRISLCSVCCNFDTPTFPPAALAADTVHYCVRPNMTVEIPAVPDTAAVGHIEHCRNANFRTKTAAKHALAHLPDAHNHGIGRCICCRDDCKSLLIQI